MNTTPSPNFAYLAHHDPRLAALGTQAEQQFAIDPSVTLAKLRQFGEVLAKRAAAKVGLYQAGEKQQELVDRLYARNLIGATQRQLFHDLRRAGNTAVHEGEGDHAEALHQLKMARELGVWFQRSFGNNRRFDPGPFIPPQEPAKVETVLSAELARLQAELEKHAAQAANAAKEAAEARAQAEAELRAREGAQAVAAKAKEEVAIWEALAKEGIATARQQAEQQSQELLQTNAKLQAELEAAQLAAQAAPEKAVAKTIAAAAKASEAIDLDEAATRRIIDRQLRDAGWEVDSQRLTFKRGARPIKGRNLAIAEWPTAAEGKDGRADYVLFVGLMCVGVVEAKRKHKDVSSVIDQAKRYSEGYLTHFDEVLPEGSPWGTRRIPFLFATNGRPFLRQFIEKSGIWFLDARRPDNTRRALEGWYTPDGLIELLKHDVDKAHAELEVEPMPYLDREYQRRAVKAVENALAKGSRSVLLAMATGTGKTITCIALCYRLLKSKRFRRVLFLVDRSALGEQTATALKHVRLEAQQPFSEIFNVKELADIRPERETKLQIATVQAMVRRLLGGDESGEPPPPVDDYDCIVVDECHRGYLLDRELSERDLTFRDEEDYISKYRRVLDHFDAVKIGLTATPALHTRDIFGPPVFQYSYREAVIDGYLIDHEPPYRVLTKLSKDGIHISAGTQVLALNHSTQALQSWNLPDRVDFEVEDFNRAVLVPEFSRAVIQGIVQEIDWNDEGKLLVFCVTDDHADLVVRLFKEELQAANVPVEDDMVVKITGASDKPLALLRRYRNERFNPKIAVTVDLLTTGVDVPRITTLVFLRRVRSRILYEQMLGRATRLCEEIGKTVFRIYDAVDLYSNLQEVSDMKPVVVSTSVTFGQLVNELDEQHQPSDRLVAAAEFLAKFHRKKRLLKRSPEAMARFCELAEMSMEDFIEVMRSDQLGAINKLCGRPLAEFLDGLQVAKDNTILFTGGDALLGVSTGGEAPADYLKSFESFLRENMNKVPALLVVAKRPRDLTRAELRKLKLALSEAGFSEAGVRAAWRNAKNEDVAASIIGFIRGLALGSPVKSYSARVDGALLRVAEQHNFKDTQRRWLQRIGDQMKAETVVDREALDSDQFKQEGGFRRIDRVFEGQLEAVLGEIADEVWKDAV